MWYCLWQNVSGDGWVYIQSENALLYKTLYSGSQSKNHNAMFYSGSQSRGHCYTVLYSWSWPENNRCVQWIPVWCSLRYNFRAVDSSLRITTVQCCTKDPSLITSAIQSYTEDPSLITTAIKWVLVCEKNIMSMLMPLGASLPASQRRHDLLWVRQAEISSAEAYVAGH